MIGSLLIVFCFVWVLVDLMCLVDLVGFGFVIWVEVMGGGAMVVGFGFCNGFLMGVVAGDVCCGDSVFCLENEKYTEKENGRKRERGRDEIDNKKELQNNILLKR